MELSPEERLRIYEEEKARIEAEQQAGENKQGSERAATTNLEPNVAGLLCYLGIWVTGIIFLILEQRSRFVRFHAIQSIIVFGFLFIADAILSQIPLVGWFFGFIIGISAFILWIVLMVKAYHGELYVVPLAGDLAQKISGVSSIEKRPAGEAAKAAEKPSTVPRADVKNVKTVRLAGDRKEEYLKNTHAGRITASSLAIAWSLVLLIFFNLFSQYIAFYEYSSGEWLRCPLLTADYNAWLPIINVALVFSLLGHILIIIVDSYLLRETTLIILNLFVLAAVSSLLSIFPFNFSVIPNNALADISPVMVTIALVVIVIGLGIATLVNFIRLIVSAATNTAHF
ncbi:DUF4870 domain-containing protein [Chloroflexota bacterium]